MKQEEKKAKDANQDFEQWHIYMHPHIFDFDKKHPVVDNETDEYVVTT